MWSRKEIKDRAKEVLKRSYWKAFVVSLVLTIVTGRGLSSGSSNTKENYSTIPFEEVVAALIIVVFIMFALILIRVLVGYILEIGCIKYFIKASEEDVNMGYIGNGFSEGRYWNILITMFLRDIKILLWSLLLLIPGIIKMYAYRMVPYILADNPSIKPSRAMELSQKMTDGEKANMFILDLSFIGWFILGSLALGVGLLFVYPYYDTVYAELYLVLRDNIIEKQLTTYEELNIKNTEEDMYK